MVSLLASLTGPIAISFPAFVAVPLVLAAWAAPLHAVLQGVLQAVRDLIQAEGPRGHSNTLQASLQWSPLETVRCCAQCPKVRWRQCEACQQRIQEEGLEDEFHLQSWFVGRINSFLKAQGRILIGWDEILEGGLSPGAVVMSWRVQSL